MSTPLEIGELDAWRLERVVQRETLRALRASARQAGVELHRTGLARYAERTELEAQVIRYFAQRMRETLANVETTLPGRLAP